MWMRWFVRSSRLVGGRFVTCWFLAGLLYQKQIGKESIWLTKGNHHPMTAEHPSIIVDGKGTLRQVTSTPEITPEENTIVFPDKRAYSVNWRRNFERLTALKGVIEEAEIVQEEGTYQVKMDRPDVPYAMGLVFSDAHIGAYSSDHELITRTLDLLHTTPNSFLVDCGDTFNSGIWGSLPYEDMMPPYMQQFTVEDLIREFGEKYAACVIGNHPEWLFDNAGVKPEFMFARAMKGPVFPGMGLLHLKVGKQNYDWALAHNYWGKSRINIHNVCVRLRENEYPNADVFTVGHQHIWGFMKEKVDGREVLYIRPGTAKTEDRYARIHGIAKRGQAFGLAVIFGANKKEFNCYNIEDAVALMKVRAGR